jgi:hypothetical protein
MAIAAWQLPNKWLRQIIPLVLLATAYFLYHKPLQHFIVLNRLTQEIKALNRKQVHVDLDHIWRCIEGTVLHEPWFEQAQFDLTNLHHHNVNTEAQVKLIRWFLEQGGDDAARFLIESNNVFIPSGPFLMPT